MLPGLPSAPKNWGLEVSALLRLKSRAARPSSPVMGLDSVTCIAVAVRSAVIFAKPATGNKKTSLPELSGDLRFGHPPSTRQGWPSTPLKNPSWNIWALATPSPSDRLKILLVVGSVYFHRLPAPASSRTETRKRSTSLRAFSLSSTCSCDHLVRRGSIRERPASRWRQRPCGWIYGMFSVA